MIVIPLPDPPVVITTELAPEPFEGTDVNPRCLCGHDEHPDGTCPRRCCGCRENRTAS
jgi:hypothetical protein